MIHFNEGDTSEFINPEFEIAVSGDYNETDLIPVRHKGSSLSTAAYQANFIATGVNL